jgi:iron complex outermembrane receptor protein
MSLQQLANVEVTSVSKTPQPLSQSAAAIYVITHDQIVRSGATNIPQALRLAPNLTVTQLSATDYVVQARGLGGNPNDQNFSNKLLMLIDGRSVYTPLYSGIYMDAQDVVLDDVDRIEVISGPGATLWGANAMNGVINIITRSADATRGALVRAGAGNQEQRIDARYGGQLNEDTAFRFYGLSFHDGAERLADGSNAHDGWSKTQGGFRLDWQHAADSATVQGDLYHGSQNQPETQDGSLSGGNILTRWQHRFSGTSTLQIQAYMDQTEQFAPAGGSAFALRTYDLQAQQNFALGSLQELLLGAGERVNDYAITNTATLLFVPSSRTLTLGNVFIQDTLKVSSALSIVAGFKVENDPYSGWSPLPDLRVSWSVSDQSLLWAAASRSIRSPTPFDVDVQEKLGSLVYLTGNSDFKPEKLTAYQLGYRSQLDTAATLSIATYYNHYDDLRSVEFSPGPAILEWGNRMRGDTTGVEAWADIQVLDWWRLSPGIRTTHEGFELEPGSSGLLGSAQAGNDPSYQASLTSAMDIRHDLTLDASLRYVSALPEPALPGYYALAARLGWQATHALLLSLDGENLLRSRHLEYPAPVGEYITRSVMLEARWQL